MLLSQLNLDGKKISLIMNDSLRLLVQKITKLPTIPGIAHKILSVISHDSSSAGKLEQIIRKDPVTTAKILSLSNSAFFGLGGSTSTIKKAIIRIGLLNVKNIAIGIAMMTVLETKGSRKFLNFEQIFQHSLAVSMTSDYLGKFLKIDGIDDISLSGILHDIGFLILDSYFPEISQKIMEEFRIQKNLYQAEMSASGVTHAEIGAWLADKWKLPDQIINTVLYHHSPSAAKSHIEQTALIHLADYIVTRSFVGVTAESANFPLDRTALEILSIKEEEFGEMELKIKKRFLKDE